MMPSPSFSERRTREPPPYRGVADVPRVYAPPWMNTMTGRGFALGALGASTLSVRQSSLDGWYLPIASIVPRLC